MRRSPLLLAIASATTLLLGCAVPTPDLLTTSHQAYFGGAQTPVAAEWWRAHSNKELQELVDLALRDNPGLAVLTERRLAAAEANTGGLLRLLPSLNVQAVAGGQSRGGFASQFQPSTYPYSSISTSWELPLFGQAEGAWALGRSQLRRAEANEGAGRLSLVAELYQAYARAQASGQKGKVRREVLALADDEVWVVSRAVEQRLATLGDLNTAVQWQADAREKLRATESDGAKALNALRHLVGSPTLQVSLDEPLSLPLPERAPEPEWMRARPDLVAAEAAVGEAAAQVGIARSELWPQLSLSGSVSKAVGVASSSTHNAAITIPLLGWFAAKEAADARTHEMKAAVYSYRDTLLAAWRESLDAHLDLLDAEAGLTKAQRLQVLADQEAAANARGHFVGAVSAIANKRAQATAVDRASGELDAQTAYRLSWARYRKATFGVGS